MARGLKHRLVTIGIVLTLGHSALLAADFWQEKNFEDWSKEEIGKMLLDSPWARRTTVELKGTAEFEVQSLGGGLDMSSDMDLRRGDLEDGGRSGGRRELGRGSSSATPPAPRIEVVVRWQTALPVKKAIARFHYGDYTEPSWNITKMLYLGEPYYIAGIIGLPRRLVGPNPDDLKSAATLKIRKQPAIQAVGVVTEELMRGDVNLFFFFPKLQEGARVITAADKEVEVVLETSNIEIRRMFKLTDLMYNGRPEL